MVPYDEQPGAARDASADDAGDHAAAPPVPVASIVENVIGCKWSVRLLQLCAEGERRPSEFLRSCTGLSAKVMNERLRKLTRYGIVQRTVHGDKPPIEVEYRLTPFGLRFMGVIEEVRRLQDSVDRDTVGRDGAT